jgi:hypothetical protein
VARKKQPNHREILNFYETHILNRNLGISEQGNAAFYFVHSVLRAYATSEQVNADRKRNAVGSPVLAGGGEKVQSTVDAGSVDPGAK